MSAIFEFDGFISYNRRDKDFAARLERDIERFSVPKTLRKGSPRLKVFRDTDDMTGSDYEKAIRRHLDASRKLIVVCSPNARSSNFVNEEIAYFIEGHSPESIIPVLVDGIPNNETEDDSLCAFPRALVEGMGMPLGIDYRSWSSGPVSVREFRDQWYTVLAALLDTSRDQIEQRDHKQKVARWRLIGGIAATVLVVTGLLAHQWWTTKVESEAATALRSAAGKADVQQRALALSRLVDGPEAAGALQATWASADALFAVPLVEEWGGVAEMLWDARAANTTVSADITPLAGSSLDPGCTFDRPAAENVNGLNSPDGTLEVYLHQDQLVVQRADGFGTAAVYCLRDGSHMDTSSGSVRWREGTDTLEGRVGFGESDGRPLVLVKDINQPSLFTVPAYRPGVRYFRLANVEDAEFTAEGNLIVTFDGSAPKLVRLPPGSTDDPARFAPECFEYAGDEKPLAEILADNGHPGFDMPDHYAYTNVRGCYLDNRRILAIVTAAEQLPLMAMALNTDDLDREISISTMSPECTAFGRSTMSYCQSGDHSMNEYNKEAGVIRFNAGSAARLPVDDVNWRPFLAGEAIASANGNRLLIWGKPPLNNIPIDSPAYIWLDGEDNNDPFLIDNSASIIADATFSPNSEYLFIRREDGTMKIWSFETGLLMNELAERITDVTSESSGVEN